MWSCPLYNKRGNNSVSRDIRRVYATAGYPFEDHNESLTAGIYPVQSDRRAATSDTMLDNSIS